MLAIIAMSMGARMPRSDSSVHDPPRPNQLPPKPNELSQQQQQVQEPKLMGAVLKQLGVPGYQKKLPNNVTCPRCKKIVTQGIGHACVKQGETVNA